MLEEGKNTDKGSSDETETNAKVAMEISITDFEEKYKDTDVLRTLEQL